MPDYIIDIFNSALRGFILMHMIYVLNVSCNYMIKSEIQFIKHIIHSVGRKK